MSLVQASDLTERVVSFPWRWWIRRAERPSGAHACKAGLDEFDVALLGVSRGSRSGRGKRGAVYEGRLSATNNKPAGPRRRARTTAQNRPATGSSRKHGRTPGLFPAGPTTPPTGRWVSERVAFTKPDLSRLAGASSWCAESFWQASGGRTRFRRYRIERIFARNSLLVGNLAKVLTSCSIASI